MHSGIVSDLLYQYRGRIDEREAPMDRRTGKTGQA